MAVIIGLGLLFYILLGFGSGFPQEGTLKSFALLGHRRLIERDGTNQRHTHLDMCDACRALAWRIGWGSPSCPERLALLKPPVLGHCCIQLAYFLILRREACSMLRLIRTAASDFVTIFQKGSYEKIHDTPRSCTPRCPLLILVRLHAHRFFLFFA